MLMEALEDHLLSEYLLSLMLLWSAPHFGKWRSPGWNLARYKRVAHKQDLVQAQDSCLTAAFHFQVKGMTFCAAHSGDKFQRCLNFVWNAAVPDCSVIASDEHNESRALSI